VVVVVVVVVVVAAVVVVVMVAVVGVGDEVGKVVAAANGRHGSGGVRKEKIGCVFRTR
jgi:hypothetical protein